jgi:RecA-family ATPase
VAKTIRVVSCTHLWSHLDPSHAGREPPANGDVDDWIYYGGDVGKLTEICREIPAEGAIAAKSHDFPAEETIPMWDFVYDKHLLRDTVSVTAATGGTGKSSTSIAEALAQTSAKSILGIPVSRPLRVVLINLEDDRNTMNKRIAAAMKHHDLTKDDVGDRLIVIARGEIKLKVAKQLRSGDVERNEMVIKALTNLMIEHRADVLSVDSFIRTHKVNENDNSAIEEVIECFEDVALAANCVVHLWHHTRKGNGEGASVDSLRGAKSITDACRSARIFETTTKEAAAKLKIEHPGFYFRAFSGKRNFAPPLDKSDFGSSSSASRSTMRVRCLATTSA